MNKSSEKYCVVKIKKKRFKKKINLEKNVYKQANVKWNKELERYFTKKKHKEASVNFNWYYEDTVSKKDIGISLHDGINHLPTGSREGHACWRFEKHFYRTLIIDSRKIWNIKFHKTCKIIFLNHRVEYYKFIKIGKIKLDTNWVTTFLKIGFLVFTKIVKITLHKTWLNLEKSVSKTIAQIILHDKTRRNEFEGKLDKSIFSGRWKDFPQNGRKRLLLTLSASTITTNWKIKSSLEWFLQWVEM